MRGSASRCLVFRPCSSAVRHPNRELERELDSQAAHLRQRDVDGGVFVAFGGAQQYLTPSTPESEREMEGVSAAIDKANAVSNDEEFQATATDGTQITGLIGGTGAKSGNPSIGNGPFLAGDSCIVGVLSVFGG
jgi:hypothetical protein